MCISKWGGGDVRETWHTLYFDEPIGAKGAAQGVDAWGLDHTLLTFVDFVNLNLAMWCTTASKSGGGPFIGANWEI